MALVAWLVFYLGFLWYAARSKEYFLFLDNLNLVIHEAGHPLFGLFGYVIGILGGTLMELIVPLGIAIYFWWNRHTTGVAFCAFWFFENFLYIGTYMADARSQGLPLVTVGDAEEGSHDWFNIFSSLGLLEYDRTIGGLTRVLGWLGMLATVGWLLYRWRQSARHAR